MKRVIPWALALMLSIWYVHVNPAYGATIGVPADQPTIQAGIEAAEAGDTVLVAPGTFTETIDFLGKAIAVRSDGGEEVTVIDGARAGTVVTFTNQEGAESIIDGFTIRNGDARFGGGIFCNASSPTITNCILSGNNVSHYGGAIFCSSSSPANTNCNLSENSADYGGGIYCISSFPTIRGCTISNNTADYGGGIWCNYSSFTLTNCTISGGHADYYGGGICLNTSSPTITHCTIADNWAGYYGGGILCEWLSSPTVSNCIFWGDDAGVESPEIWASSGSPVFTYSDIQGGWPGTGNIDADPLFIGSGDYHLRDGSPCIDTGADVGVDFDIDGDVRPHGDGVDMGSDEYTSGPQACFIGLVM